MQHLLQDTPRCAMNGVLSSSSYLLLPTPNPLICRAAMDEPLQKRSKFSFDACRKPLASKGRLPDLSQLRESVKDMRAPHAVRSKFWGPPKFVGIDIETHALAPTSASPVWRTDEFGILTKATEEAVSNLRIVQLGWVRSGDGSPVIKTKLVKPDGFVIEQGATDKHHITHEEASENGLSMQAVLREFLDDVTAAVGEGHRLCAHHLGFDAGIILKEMGRVGLHDRTEEWMQLVSPGLCTMDPSIGQWVREQIGVWDVPRKIPMRLKDAVAHLLPNHAELLSLHHHAGNDAHMHVLLALELHRRANV